MGQAHSVNQKVTVYYFNDKGRAELTRLCLAYGQIPFEDKTYGAEEYAQLRLQGRFNFEQLPILEIGETQLSQSCAMARWAAKKAGIYPLDDILQAAKSDMIVDAWRDILDLYYACFFPRKFIDGRLVMVPIFEDKEQVQTLLKEFVEHTLIRHFRVFDNMLEKNKPSNFLVGQTLTWADLAVFDLVSTFDPQAKAWNVFGVPYPESFLEQFPNLLTLRGKIEANHTIQQWIKGHPYSMPTPTTSSIDDEDQISKKQEVVHPQQEKTATHLGDDISKKQEPPQQQKKDMPTFDTAL